MRCKGSCHCGKVAFAVEGDLSAGAVAGNCSLCSRKGALLVAVPRDDLRLLSPQTDPFAEDSADKSERMAYVNVRCLDGIDLLKVAVRDFDGRSM